MRIVFMGTPESAAEVLRSLIEDGHEILGVFTQPDKPKGRGKKLAESPVKKLAGDEQIPVFQPANFKDPQILEDLKLLAPEVMIVVAYGRIIPKEILEFPKYGCLNLHFSLLPKYRGASPISAALKNGDRESGVTIFKIEEKLDSGPIYAQARLKISADDTSASLEVKLTAVAAELLARSLPDIQAGKISDIRQDDFLASYAPQLKKEDGLIDWSRTSEQIVNHVRAMDPWPSAFTFFNNKLLKIWKAEKIQSSKFKTQNNEGGIIEINNQGIAVKTGDGAILLLEVQIEGGRRLPAAEFGKGHGVRQGIRLSGDQDTSLPSSGG